MRKYTVSFTETIEAEDESAAYDAMLDRMADDVKNGDVTCYDFTEIMDTPPETPAACMIAAAPAMLAALQYLGAAIENGDPQDIADAWHHAQALIP